jgi:hypothetical protein
VEGEINLVPSNVRLGTTYLGSLEMGWDPMSRKAGNDGDWLEPSGGIFSNCRSGKTSLKRKKIRIIKNATLVIS